MLCCVPKLSHAKFQSDYAASVNSADGVNAYNCQYYAESSDVSESSKAESCTNHSLYRTQGYQKCFDCYRKFAEKYAPLCPRLQTVLYKLRNETDPNVGACQLRTVMDDILDDIEKKKLPPFGAECHKFKNWHTSLDRDFSTHAIFDGIESTPIVLLTDAVKAIWDDPRVWDGLSRKPPTLEADLTASKGEYKCGLLNGVKLAEEFARNKLRGKSCDDHGLGINDIAAIHLYTQSKQDGTHCCLFKYLNAALENKSGSSEEMNMSAHIALVKPYFKYIRLLQHALLKLPPANGSEILFRGERNTSKIDTYAKTKRKIMEYKNMAPNKFPLWAFSSTTDDAQAAEGYLGREEATLWEKDGTSKSIEIPFQGARILYTIDGGSSARDVKEYSAVPEDNESLFCCATAFTIKSVIGINSGMLVVHMKQGGKQNSEQGGSNGETKN